MTVSELIKALKSFPGENEVFIGSNDIVSIEYMVNGNSIILKGATGEQQ